MKRITIILVAALILLVSCAKLVKPAGIMLTYSSEPAQVEIVTSSNRTIFMDVTNTGLVSKAPTSDAVLLTTHLHTDHYYKEFTDTFPGQQLLNTTGKIELLDAVVIGIAAAHNTNDPILESGGTNYIYVIETGGLRIAHFGDIGQDTLNAEQLEALGSIDVAIMQFSNSFSDMSADNLKGFNLMDQLKPRLIIPTHSDSATIKIALERWKGYYSDSRTVTISSANLPTEGSILILGNLAAAYNNIYGLELWE